MATGDTLAVFMPAAATLPSSNYPTFDVNGGGLLCLDFDDSTSESCYFHGIMPGQYDGSTAITVVLHWKFSTYVGSQTCDWEAAFYRIADDTDTAETLTFATAQTGVFTEASATGELDYAEIDLTNAQADGVQANENFVLKITRDASGGTASPGDAELYAVEIKLQ